MKSVHCSSRSAFTFSLKKSHLFQLNFIILLCNLLLILLKTLLKSTIEAFFIFQVFLSLNLTDGLDLVKCLIKIIHLISSQGYYLVICCFCWAFFLGIQFYAHQILDSQYGWHIFCNTWEFILLFLQDIRIIDLDDWHNIKWLYLNFAFLQYFYSN